MKKVIVVGLAMLAVSTSAALAAKKSKAPAAAPAAMAGPGPLMQPTAKDLEMYKKNQADSGMAKKKK